MGTNRIINSSFWDDEKVIDFTTEEKLFWAYCLTNPHTSLLGIYKFVPKIAAFELGFTQEKVEELLHRFESNYNLIRFNPETFELAIKNALRYSIAKGGTPILEALKREGNQVRDTSLFEFIMPAASESNNETIIRFYDEYLRHINTDNNENVANRNANRDANLHKHKHKQKQKHSEELIILGDFGKINLSTKHLAILKAKEPEAWEQIIKEIDRYLASKPSKAKELLGNSEGTLAYSLAWAERNRKYDAERRTDKGSKKGNVRKPTKDEELERIFKTSNQEEAIDGTQG